ncbi:MAG: hypothetical protein JWO22_839 [Frankiales bacterium]|nr:hypothetical protein [Frankiales bacterium]
MTDILGLLPRAIHDIRCGDESHQLAWSHGAITTLDHADPDGERTLAALGGQRSRCIDVLDAWQRQRHSLRVLAIAPRSPADFLVGDDLAPVPQSGARPGRLSSSAGTRWSTGLLSRVFSTSSAYSSSVAFGWASTSGGTQPPPELAGSRDDIDLMMLLGLGSGLPHRLVAEVLCHWADRVEELPESAPELPALTAALYGRATAAVRPWMGDHRRPVEVTRVPSGQVPRMTADRDGVVLEVPFRWLTHVWVMGLATTAGRLALDATFDDGAVTLQTVGPEGGESTPMTVQLP